MNRLSLKKSVLTAATALCVSGFAYADSNDALLNVLVNKGILTEAEATDVASQLKSEAEASAEVVMPQISASSQVEELDLYGDLRLRYEYQDKETQNNPDTIEKNRFRYRLRLGANYDFKDSNWSAGVRLETGNGNNSTNVDYGNYFDKSEDGLNVGLAYLKYDGEDLDVLIGKHKKPFYMGGAFWDSDINPEGVSISYALAGATVYGGVYAISDDDEDDDYLYLLQAEMGGNGFKIAPTLIATSAGTTANAVADNNFDNFMVFALPTEYKFKLDGVSQKVFATYGINLNGDDAINENATMSDGTPGDSAHNQFFNLGYQYGSAKKQGQWQAAAEYRYVEAASYSRNLIDSDFGGGYMNQQGFLLKGKYALTDFMSVGATYSASDDIDDTFKSSSAKYGRVTYFQLDLAAKF